MPPPADHLVTFAPSANPLSIRASALVFVDQRSQRLRDQVQQLATAPLALLIQAEMGTGKELLARHIHRESQRAGLFVAVNCQALSLRHGEAELFGQVPSGQTVGASSRMGWLGSANGGTLYLDEIADLPLSLQQKLLYCLENGEVERVGSDRAESIDVRLIAATSIDLAKAIAAGRFEPKLYEYLADGLLQLAALRDRPGDIVPMAEYFLGIYSQRLGMAVPSLSDQAIDALVTYPWPGNTRELEHVIHFALLEIQGPVLEAQHLRLCQPFR